jgi:hypothetical protein
MKRTTAFLAGLLLISVAFITDSCEKKVKGCTDPDSVNYDRLAEKDDGSCRYEGELVVWYGQQASAGLTGDGATSLTFYLNGDVVGSTAASVFWAAEPDCGENGSITVTQDLGKNKQQDYTLSVKDQDGFEYWNTKVTIKANTCLALELTWASRKKK